VWQDLRRSVEKQQVIEHYGDSKMPMQLRMLAKAVYGRSLMGQDGTFMRKQMAKMEVGGSGDEFVSMMNMSRT
jgi:splicing suppressor protein 51